MITIPNTFYSGDRIYANKVNENFTALADATGYDINVASIESGSVVATEVEITTRLKSAELNTPAVTSVTLIATAAFLNGLSIGVTEENLTIAAAAVTVTNSHIKVQAPDVANDELETIDTSSFGPGGLLLISKSGLGEASFTIKNGAGNIICGADLTMTEYSTALFMYDYDLDVFCLMSYQIN
jgi:hypothetical protein